MVASDIANISEGGALPLSEIKGGDHIPGVSAQRKASDDLMSIASIETQPPVGYGHFTPMYQTTEYGFDHDKHYNGYEAYYQNCYGLENSWSYNCPSTTVDNMQMLNQQLPLDAQQSHYTAASSKDTKFEQEGHLISPGVMDYSHQDQASLLPPQPNPIECAHKKIVAVNPVILVDKVERSLIVQWYENGVRREQRISYKKYGNAKAQQRAESLIAKLLSGSTFDQLYPEKGPPILTIFENVGEFKVSLTRDRTMREWRVDWVNSHGAKMRARWSCKKVGNEEAKKRAEAFANSLLQGKFNLRLLHKATGTRLSRNDMKYNTVLNDVDYPKQHLFLCEDDKGSAGNVGDMQEVSVKKRNTTPNPESQRKRATRTTTRKRKTHLDYFAGFPTIPNDYLKVPADASFPGFYPMYQGECDSNSSVLGRSYDSMPGHGDNLLVHNWQSWNSAPQNLDYSGSAEWDYNDPQLDYRRYNQIYDMPHMNFMHQMDWMNNSGCMMKYMPPGIDAPMSTRELNEETRNEAQNPSGTFYPYYHHEGSLSYSDNVCTQDQIGVSGSYFDLDYMNSENQNSQTQCSYASPPWTQADTKSVESSQNMQTTKSVVNDDGALSQNAGVVDEIDKADLQVTRVIQSSKEAEVDSSKVGPVASWPGFGSMKMRDLSLNDMKRSREYSISSLPTMYPNDGFDYINPEYTDSTKCDEGATDCFKDQLNMSESQGFYTSVTMR